MNHNNNNNNGSIKLVETKTKGRSLISSRPLKAGEVILKDSPILLYSAAADAVPHHHNYCSHCFRSIPQPLTTILCPNCTSLFCSQHCQTLALSTSHTPFICQSLTRLFAPGSPLLGHPVDRHLQARFLVSAYNLSVVSPPLFRTLLSLQGEVIDDEKSLTFLHGLVSAVCPLPPIVGEFGFSLQLTAALLAKDKLNAFGLMEPFDSSNKERSVRAYGIYPKASFFNHDCLPNACRFDYVDSVVVDGGSNVDIVVRVIHDLPEDREICLSYFPVNFNYGERQKRLKEDYGFTCDCDRCKVEASWSDNEGEMDQEEDMDEDEDDDDDDDKDEDVGNDDMGEDLDTEDGGRDKENDDFPHAYFFVRYMCSRDNCGGTLAPLPPADARPSTVMECNVCGNLSNSEDLMNGNGQLQ